MTCPIFIVGSEGSGARVLADVFRKAELPIGSHLDETFNSMPFDAVCERFVTPVLEQTGGPDYRLDLIDGDLRTRVSNAIDLAAGLHTETLSGSSQWLVKCPRLLFLIPFLADVFPDMHLLQVIRDCRDIPTSANRRQIQKHYRALFGDPPDGSFVEATAHFWAQANIHAASIAKRALGYRHHVQRFESLCANPRGSVSALLDAMGIEVSPNILDRSVGGFNTRHDPAHGVSLANPAGETIAQAGAVGLGYFGYMTSAPNDRPTATRAEAAAPDATESTRYQGIAPVPTNTLAGSTTKSRGWHGSVKTALEHELARPLSRFGEIAGYSKWIELIEPDRLASAGADGAPAHFPDQTAVVVLSDPGKRQVPRAIVDLARQPGCESLCLVARPSATDKISWPGGPSKVVSLSMIGAKDWLPRILAEIRAEWFVFVEADAGVSGDFLSIVATAMRHNPAGCFLHGDFDTVSSDGTRCEPTLKPSAWDGELPLQCDILRGWFAIRRGVLAELQTPESPIAGVARYELGLTASERARPETMVHVPHILTHLPPSQPTDETRMRRGIEAVRRRALARRSWNATLEPGASALTHHPRFALPAPVPKVSVIVPTRDGAAELATCLHGLQYETDYENLEIIVIDNGSRDPGTLDCLDRLAGDPRCSVIRHDKPFNFAEIMNTGVSRATGSLICMLNDDIRILHSNWLSEMAGLALRDDVGIVGSLLIFEDGTVQHAGVTLGLLGNVAGHDFHYEPEARLRQHPRYGLVHQTSAVTAACAVMRREVFQVVGGMDTEHLAVNYNDVDLCLKIGARGLKVLWTPYARLVHAESITRGREDKTKRVARGNAEAGWIASRWPAELALDRFWNPNMSLESPAPELSFLPPANSAKVKPSAEQNRDYLMSAAREVARTASILPEVHAFHAAKIAHHLELDNVAARLTLEAVVEAPDAYTANLVAGTCAAKLGDDRRAYVFYRNANLISPRAVRPWLYRGLTAERLGWLEEAVVMLATTLRHDPYNRTALAAMRRFPHANGTKVGVLLA